jgi:outer membrane receptor protein involved in Fe transport
MSRGLGLAGLFVAALAVVPVGARSQTAIEEIIVNTRKKEEKLQDVPISITAITAEQIERRGVKDLNDVVKSTPGIQFDTSFGPSDTRITIRGLSNTRGRSNVAFLIDGIDVTTENLIAAGSGLLANRRLLSDVKSIEVVKGPQSALFGRAAFAGAISYTTQEPGDEFAGQVAVDAAKDGFYQASGIVSGPLTDKIGVRLLGQYFAGDGHYVNSISGQPVGDSHGTGFALTTVFKPADDVKLKFRAEYSRDFSGPRPAVRVGGGWQDTPVAALFKYPAAIIANGVQQANLTSTYPGASGDVVAGSLYNGLGFARNANSTGLLDFGQYCPDRLKEQNGTLGTQSFQPGFCLPKSFGRAKYFSVAQSENPFTGKDYPGTDQDTFRFSAKADFDVEYGSVTNYTGWTDFNAHDFYDQDYQADPSYRFYLYPKNQALPALDASVTANLGGRAADRLLGSQQASAFYDTKQFSDELRFGSKLDGPVQFTAGALFWHEERKVTESNYIISCFPFLKQGVWASAASVVPFSYDSGVCDGTGGTVSSPQKFAQEVGNPDGSGISRTPWAARTNHFSFYGNIEWSITDQWKISVEDRWISEHFTLERPNQSSCTNIATNMTIGQKFLAGSRGDKFGSQVIQCGAGVVLEADALPGNLVGTNSFRLIEGTVVSHYNTPKVTLNWKPTADSLVYGSWGLAVKPGGINQTAAGASAVSLADQKFDPEKLTAYEVGTKNTFDFVGVWRVNLAGFYNDYNKKQIGTQIVDSSGVSQPRIINAGAARTYGVDFELNWQPQYVDGLLLSLAYTYVKSEFTKFTENVTSLQRIAYAGRCDRIVYTGRAIAALQASGTAPGLLSDPAYAKYNTGPRGTPDPNNIDDPRNGGVACQQNFEGNALERTPEHEIVGSANFVRPLFDTGMNWFGEGNFLFQSSRYNDQENVLKFNAYWNFDVRAGIQSEKWEVAAYVDNVLDNDTVKTGGSGPDFGRQVSELGFTAGLGVSHYFAVLPDPRIFGIRGTYRFGRGR